MSQCDSCTHDVSCFTYIIIILCNVTCDVFTNCTWICPFFRYRMYETVYDKKDNRFGQSPMFGNNYGVTETGTISIGDTVSCK